MEKDKALVPTAALCLLLSALRHVNEGSESKSVREKHDEACQTQG